MLNEPPQSDAPRIAKTAFSGLLGCLLIVVLFLVAMVVLIVATDSFSRSR